MRRPSTPTLLVLLALACAPPLIAQSPGASAYLEASDSSRTVGQEYLQAYIALDWDRIESMLGDAASFQDPTAELIFGGKLVSGRDNMMAKFRTGYAGIQMSFVETRAVYSGHYAIIEGLLTWSAPLGDGRRVTAKDSPFVLILRIEGGLVVEHRDYADYHPFITAMRAM
ncbi:MAG: nuclear transport factor 2 family protein [Gemmatimonadales bacterium]